MSLSVLITGASGMIGGLVLERCLESEQVQRVVSLVRRPSGILQPKLEEVVIKNFESLDREADYFQSIDVVLYCLGVYTGAVGRDEFRRITVAYPETLAKVLKQTSPQLRFCLLSGQGADRKEKSRMIFAKDKGAIENRLSKMQFGSFHSFRPGYIYPVEPREEPNNSYRVMRALYPAYKLLGRYASIRSTELADAMFHVGLNGAAKETLENKDIHQYVSGNAY